MNTFQGVQEQEITNTLSKRQLALWWWVGLIFIWGKGRIWKYFGWNQSVVLKRPNKTDHIVMISFESLSVLLPGQMHINGSKQWHQCLVSSRARAVLALSPSVPVPAAVLCGDALGSWLFHLCPDCIPPLLIFPVSLSVQVLGFCSYQCSRLSINLCTLLEVGVESVQAVI